ncbi:MAG TPA: right-handed parallel beta-helix repeat-containing protein [Candidatus Acidoferrales bacterium]|nr:right-handed parallel beta-helix repeat-containing protein [Candidatus Acidoferrales bacterium]
MGGSTRIVGITLMGLGVCFAGAYASGTAIRAAQSRRAVSGGAASLPAVECTSYVSPGGADSNPGTKEKPWRTAQRAFDAAEPGQTICFRGGTYPMVTTGRYSQTLIKAGARSIKAGAKSIKAGAKSETESEIKPGMKSAANSGRNSGTEPGTNLGSGARPITITNYPGETAIIEGSTRVEASHVTFRGTPDAHPGLIFQGPTGRQLGLIEVMYSHDVTFDHVEIRGADYHAGFYQYGGDHIRLLGSYIHDNGIAGSNLDQGIYWDKTSGGGNLIANCVIEHNAANGIALYAGSDPDEPSQVTIEENTIVGNGHYGVGVYGTRNAIVNNVLADNGAAFHSQQLGIEHGTDHVVDSNILWSPAASRQGMYDPAGQRVTQSIMRDPLFVDAGAHDYRLRRGSPAIGAGNPRYAQAVDRDGVKRQAEAAIGAYAK